MEVADTAKSFSPTYQIQDIAILILCHLRTPPHSFLALLLHYRLTDFVIQLILNK